MIKVQFKNNYENMYSGKGFLYKDYPNAEVGDIVVANTVGGYAIARVSEINVYDATFDLNRLQTIEKVVITKKEQEEREKIAYEKKVKMAKFVEEARRKAALQYLTSLTTDAEFLKDLSAMSTSELEVLMKFFGK